MGTFEIDFNLSEHQLEKARALNCDFHRRHEHIT